MTIKTAKEFDIKLKRFVNAQKLTMKYALELSIYTIQQYQEHGNLVPAQRLHDDMVKNWTRRSAYVKWLSHFAPTVQMENGKFSKKDGTDHKKTTDVEGALKKPFWEFSPETEVLNYNLDDVNKALLAVLDKFSGKKYHPNTEQAVVVQMQRYRSLFEKAAA